MFKKIISLFVLSTGLAAPALAVSTPGDGNAVPVGFFFKPYVGADYQYISASYKDNIGGTGVSGGDLYADSFNGGDIHIGARVHKYLGFETGYFDTAHSSQSNILGTTVKSSAKLDGWTLDAMGYLPIGESQKFELIGTFGIARTTASGSARVNGTTYSENGSETKGRIGGGAEYWLTDNLNLRGLVRYQGADFGGFANDVIITSLGLNYQF